MPILLAGFGFIVAYLARYAGGTGIYGTCLRQSTADLIQRWFIQVSQGDFLNSKLSQLFTLTRVSSTTVTLMLENALGLARPIRHSPEF